MLNGKTNFGERRNAELRRSPIPRIWVNKPTMPLVLLNGYAAGRMQKPTAKAAVTGANLHSSPIHRHQLKCGGDSSVAYSWGSLLPQGQRGRPARKENSICLKDHELENE